MREVSCIMMTHFSLRPCHNGQSDIFISEERVLFHDIAQTITVVLHLCSEHVRAVYPGGGARPLYHVFLVRGYIECLAAVGCVGIDSDVNIVAL